MRADVIPGRAQPRAARSTSWLAAPLRRLPSHRLAPHVACIVGTLSFFIADLILPRGTTPAIGYCLVLVVAAAAADRRFLLVVAISCTVLTWIGYFAEPPGAPWWMSVFERGMVSGVLWVTLVLLWRRTEQDQALRHQAQELQRSNNELQSFASVASHDLRGPLSSINLLVELALMQPAVRGDAESIEHLQSMRSEIARMTLMIERLLSYARAGAGGIRLSQCDCEKILTSVRRALRAQLQSAAAQVTNDPLPTVRADPALMAELFQNLIENAIKYHSAHAPAIHVGAEATAQGWRFFVRDNGMGISPEDRARLFEPFYRGSGAAGAQGSGLGLATCQRIVKRHGGVISVESAPGQGSIFSFTIPRSPATQDALS